MPAFKIYAQLSDLQLPGKWVDSKKFKLKQSLVNQDGKPVAANYLGPRYRLMQKERISTPKERFKKVAFCAGVVFSAGLLLLNRHVRTCLRQKRCVRFGVLIPNLTLPSSAPEKVAQIGRINLLPNPLAQAAGFKNGGNTCFMAAALQALRLMPHVRARLDPQKHCLQKLPTESKKSFKTRKAIQTKIHGLINLVEQGITVEGAELVHLRRLFHIFNPISNNYMPNSQGCASAAVRLVWKALDIEQGLLSLKIYAHDEDAAWQINALDADVLDKQKLNLFASIACQDPQHANDPRWWERFAEHHICFRSEPNKLYVYAVSSVILTPPGHVFTCVKGPHTWLKYDDSHVSQIASPPRCLAHGLPTEEVCVVTYVLKEVRTVTPPPHWDAACEFAMVQTPTA